MTEDEKKHPKSAIPGVAPIQYIPDSKELYDFINEEVAKSPRKISRNNWINDQLAAVMELAKGTTASK